MRIVGGFLGLGVFSVLAASASDASEAKPSDSVSCVYEAMSPAQREVVQSLFVSTLNPLSNADNRDAIQGLINAAANDCIDLYPWPQGKTQNAKAFAMFSLIKDTYIQNMTSRGIKADDITSYFQTNKAKLGRESRATDAQQGMMISHLRTLGWKVDDPAIADTARSLFDLLHMLAYLERGFADGIARAPSPRRP